jgi:protein-disulfide isomerase
LSLKRPALAALAAVLALAGCQKAEDAAFGAKVRAYLLAHPEVLQETAAALEKKQQVELAKASSAALDRYRSQIERDPRDPVVNPGGQITVVEFFDYRCGYCKTIAPEVLEIMQKNPDVRFVMKQFSIFGEVSDSAAKIALTPDGKANAQALYKTWMNERALTEETIDRHLTEVGLDPAAVRKAAADPQIARQLLDVHALAQALRIEGTPAFIVGDVMVPGADPDALRAAIAQARAKAGRSAAAAT